MANATQEYRYLTPPEVQKLANEDWSCYVCHDNDMEKPIVSHCGTLHAAHRECTIDWLREHSKCHFCQLSFGWDQIKSQEERESSFYQKTLSAVTTLLSWGSQIATTIYPTVNACARLAETCLIEASRRLHAWGNDFYSNQNDSIQSVPIPEEPKQGPRRIYLCRSDHFSEISSTSEGTKQPPLRINSPELCQWVIDEGY